MGAFPTVKGRGEQPPMARVTRYRQDSPQLLHRLSKVCPEVTPMACRTCEETIHNREKCQCCNPVAKPKR